MSGWITDIVKDLESPILDEEVLGAEPHHEFDPRLARLAHQSSLARVSIKTGNSDPVAPESETDRAQWELESERSRGNEDEAPHALEIPFEENEFRLNRLSVKALLSGTLKCSPSSSLPALMARASPASLGNRDRRRDDE